jgi:hypothetical protein
MGTLQARLSGNGVARTLLDGPYIPRYLVRRHWSLPMHPSYSDFRKRLDAVLRQRDPMALRAFLIAEGQWDADTSTDPERAMWMMIATSPALASMRAEAIAWLSQHGYAEEAQALGGSRGEGGHASHQSQRSPRRPSGPDGQQRKPQHPSPRRGDRP